MLRIKSLSYGFYAYTQIETHENALVLLPVLVWMHKWRWLYFVYMSSYSCELLFFDFELICLHMRSHLHLITDFRWQNGHILRRYYMIWYKKLLWNLPPRWHQYIKLLTWVTQILVNSYIEVDLSLYLMRDRFKDMCDIKRTYLISVQRLSYWLYRKTRRAHKKYWTKLLFNLML